MISPSRKLFCLLAVAFVTVTCARTETAGQPFTEAEVRTLFREYLDAMAQANTTKLTELYHDDLAYVDPSGNAGDKQRVLQELGKRRATETTFTIEQEEIRIIDDVAVVQAVVRAEGGLKGQVRIQQVWIRSGSSLQQAALFSLQSAADRSYIIAQINQLQTELQQLDTQYAQDQAKQNTSGMQQTQSQISSVERQIQSLESQLHIGGGPIMTTQ